MSIKTLTTFLAFLTLFVFFVIVGFGLGHSLGMEMKSDGTMSGCLFTGETQFCPMTLVAHIGAWQQLFAVTPQKTAATSLVSLFLIATIVLMVSTNLLRKEHYRRALVATLYLRAHPFVSLYNSLRELFSRGILHPRIYAHTAF